jgi:hypothetical protein
MKKLVMTMVVLSFAGVFGIAQAAIQVPSPGNIQSVKNIKQNVNYPGCDMRTGSAENKTKLNVNKSMSKAKENLNKNLNKNLGN